ncbi:hypothetical protein HMH01_10490 [Halovulum dunhuangense]|uniref:Uncharacterized protein n=1 Tax=Halovulum dunhuangense TaxID=1505036 RepID=A0A849L3D7_9RHOB|nr:hypothetical protein [Halovulum dunhuangense]NNU80866.1 hypothetical protein [Halovulum dunhuangense]
MNKLMALLAFAVLTGFLAILAIWVPRVDLIAVIALTIALVGYDFLRSARDKG